MNLAEKYEQAELLDDLGKDQLLDLFEAVQGDRVQELASAVTKSLDRLPDEFNPSDCPIEYLLDMLVLEGFFHVVKGLKKRKAERERTS